MLKGVTAFLLSLVLISCGPGPGYRNNGNQPPEPGRGSTGTPAEKGLVQFDVRAGGMTRNYLLYVPRNLNSERPTALIMAFHGGGGNAKNMADFSGLPKLAERANILVAFPNGTKGRSANGGTWNAGSGLNQGSAEKRGVDDVAFVRAMLQDIERRYKVDQRRIYATGISKGGMFSYLLACRMSDTIAAIAPVAATMTTRSCNPSKPVRVLHIHGTEDSNIPLEGGSGSLSLANNADSYPSVQQTIDFWRRENKCSGSIQSTQKTPDTICYSSCSAVQYCVIRGGGHSWPGMEPKFWQKALDIETTQTFNAESAIWQFFSEGKW
ncbi:LpqC [Parvularcula bermudensis HTCC2503]|uniref:LpqC n=1 Tax=Parvularcula bermudensis (strain ATCC BAA-594 / HTCC2503 / KCTC 12087) TaxID=314260 RepID=E0TFF3_PARBH|nr:LpqC [Parvularcula bermudensis HTCC2503]